MPKPAAQTFAPRRGRPTAKQTAAIEKAIVDCARAMFIENGYDATAMETVALKLGISKGTLYTRYPSKEALLSAVVKDSVERWSAEAAEHDHELTDDIGQRLRHHGHIIAGSLHNIEVQAFQRLLLANGNRFPELGSAMHQHGTQFIVDLIARDMAEAGARDGLRPQRPAETALTFVSAITGWHMQQASFRAVTRDETEAFAEHLVTLFMAGRSAW
ncbi:TetR/AcrR family transcriptional regulator [Sphingomonas parapaucimobilis]|jgi:TetR/AcrR family transcriptional repressor of mexJK operon|uniref:HTH tetR-type domain-containing protein n=1 Tax=Sphingomonas parapaucimobilis NBRC 15100 TaxID=1219049 RepID=A0A0A1W9F4_9SPHN|nr:TetR/AcrR family transcriptional regulator [Sphingomonas parapaucimobilis]GAM01554.1 hypothetical protein SP5_065_00150 [Sphingomonas parapaucimobilis NBRC 15100]